MAADEGGLVWETYRLGRPAGTHYSRTANSALLFGDGSNALQTHAVRGELVEGLPPGLLGWAAMVGVGVVLGVAGTTAAPKLKVWREKRRSTESDRAQLAASDSDSQAEESSLGAIPPEQFASAVDIALAPRRTISREEADRRVLEVLLAAAVIARNMRALAGAEIEGEPLAPLQRAIEKLSKPKVTASINRALESASVDMDEATAGLFATLFGGGPDAAGRLVPVRNEKVREALRLPDGTA